MRLSSLFPRETRKTRLANIKFTYKRKNQNSGNKEMGSFKANRHIRYLTKLKITLSMALKPHCYPGATWSSSTCITEPTRLLTLVPCSSSTVVRKSLDFEHTPTRALWMLKRTKINMWQTRRGQRQSRILAGTSSQHGVTCMEGRAGAPECTVAKSGQTFCQTRNFNARILEILIFHSHKAVAPDLFTTTPPVW